MKRRSKVYDINPDGTLGKEVIPNVNPLDVLAKQAETIKQITAPAQRINEIFASAKFKPISVVDFPTLVYKPIPQTPTQQLQAVLQVCTPPTLTAFIEALSPLRKHKEQFAPLFALSMKLTGFIQLITNYGWTEELQEEYDAVQNNPFFQQFKEEYSEQKEALTAQEKYIAELKNIIVCQAAELQALRAKTLPASLPPRDLMADQIQLSPARIEFLCSSLYSIFKAAPEQWHALFAPGNINITEPIQAEAIADISLLFAYLRYFKFIYSNIYASVIGKAGAFSINGQIITSKQINATKERNDWWKASPPAPIGRNHSVIIQTVKQMLKIAS